MRICGEGEGGCFTFAVVVVVVVVGVVVRVVGEWASGGGGATWRCGAEWRRRRGYSVDRSLWSRFLSYGLLLFPFTELV